MKNLLFIALLFLTGCVNISTPQEINQIENDVGIFPHDYEWIVSQYVQQRQNDPGSAQLLTMTKPKIGSSLDGGERFGYVVCAKINVKNEYGRYTGYHTNYFLINNGKVVNALTVDSRDSDYIAKLAATKCAHYIN